MGFAGPINRTGPEGPTGLDGLDGNVWLSGIGEPNNNQGELSDFYLDTDVADVYQKLNSGWIFKINLKGPKGKAGPKGENGPQGQAGFSTMQMVDMSVQGQIFTFYNELNGLASGATSPILSFTVPTGKKFDLLSVHFDGDNVANYWVLLNAQIIGQYRTFWCQFGREVPFYKRQGLAGDVFSVVVENWRPENCDFNASIIGDQYE
jgi:hypothetical protein